MDGSEPTVVRVICGPTASGKSALALACAALGDVTIVSADSRQLYRGFDVGTAKPSAAERAAVPHLGLDLLDPIERASAAWWATSADGWLRDIQAQGRIPLVVGGTGLYLRALFDDLFEEPDLDPVRRYALQGELGLLDVAALRQWVTRLDPARAHLGRTQLMRAIEIALLTGQRISELHARCRRPARWRASYLVVDPGAPLADVIAARTRRMFNLGWAEEVRTLLRHVPADAPAWNASGYGMVRAMVQGTIGREAAVEQIVIETRQYAKRQRTWFRHQVPAADVTRLDPSAPRAADLLAAWFTDPAPRVAA